MKTMKNVLELFEAGGVRVRLYLVETIIDGDEKSHRSWHATESSAKEWVAAYNGSKGDHPSTAIYGGSETWCADQLIGFNWVAGNDVIPSYLVR